MLTLGTARSPMVPALPVLLPMVAPDCVTIACDSVFA
jgi:hypothetical protein